MPRAERPLDPEDDAVVQFARDLRLLREKAGSPTYRELSTRAHYSAAALSDAASGRKLPSLPLTLAYVAGCGGDTAEWETRWRTTAAELAASKTPEASDDGPRPPYVGLAAFQQEDADRFFGRDTLATELITRLRQHRFLGVFGASGCGKSSLLRAGMAARLAAGREQNGLPVVVFIPGQHPIEECAIHLARFISESPGTLRDEFITDPRNLHLRIRQAATRHADDSDVVPVVDQFEELFTLCTDEQERTAFIDALVTAATVPTSRTRVVLGVRADFLGHCGQYPHLVTALRDTQVLVGPMTTDELRLAITGPAEQAGYRVETALVARLVADASKQSGMLPLVAHALLQTWQRRQGSVMTLAGYDTAGGIEHALARTAEQTYQAMDTDQQALAQQIFLRLTALGEGTDDTKRRIKRDELGHGNPNTTQVLDTLTRARLITLGHDSVEIAHEALIRHWPRLRDLLVADREFLAWREELTQRRDQWERAGRDRRSLLRGVALAQAQDWRGRRGTELSHGERAFITRSHAQERRGVWAWRAASALAVVVALVVGLLAMQTVRQRDELDVSLRNVNATLLSQEAGQSSEPSVTALQFAQAAWRESPENSDAIGALWAQYTQWRTVTHTTPSDASFRAFNAVSVQGSSDGDVIAMGGLGTTVAVWQGARTDKARQTRVTTPSRVSDLDVSPDGRLVAASGDTGDLTLWSVGTRTEPSRLRQPTHHEGEETGRLSFSADSRYLAAAWHTSGVVELWDVASRQLISSSVRLPSEPAGSSAVPMPGGRTVLTTSSGVDLVEQINLRDAGTGAVLRTFAPGSVPLNDGTAVADCAPGTLRIQDTVSGADRTPTAAPRCMVDDLMDRLDNRLDRTGQFVRIEDNESLSLFGTQTYLHWATGRRYTIPFTLGGSTGITGFGSLTSDGGFTLSAPIPDGLIRFDVASPAPPRERNTVNPVEATSAVDPNGNTWVSVDGDKLVLFDSATGAERARVPAPIPGPNSSTEPTLRFMPDGTRVVATSRQELRVYRAEDLQLEHIITLPRASDALPEGVQVLASPSVAALTNDEVAVLDRDRLSWWHLGSGRPLADPVRLPTDAPVPPENQPDSLLARPSHRGQVIVDTSAELAIWDLVQRRQTATILNHTITRFPGDSGLMAVNSTGSRLAVRNTEQDKIDLWNLDTLRPLPAIPSDAHQVIGFSGDLLVLSQGVDTIQLWQADTRTRLGDGKTNLEAPKAVYLHDNTLIYNAFHSPEPGTYVMESTRLPLDPRAWFDRLCQINDRDFTTTELTRLPQNANHTRPCAGPS